MSAARICALPLSSIPGLPQLEPEAPSPFTGDKSLTREQRVEKERRAWLAGGWSEDIPKRRYIAAALRSLFVF